MSGHSAGYVKGQFCSLRTDKCDCGNKYQAVSDAVAWDKIKQKHSKKGSTERGAEAHHILCVAEVTGVITVKKDISQVVHNTKWCINDKDNMIALPTFRHTVSYYLDIKTGSDKIVLPPLFQGLANHDLDHDKYNDVINKELNDVANKAATNKANHEEASATLLSDLKKGSGSHRNGLTSRKTHAAWVACRTRDEPPALWYMAFSMSPKSATKRSFPKTTSEKLELLRAALSGK